MDRAYFYATEHDLARLHEAREASRQSLSEFVRHAVVEKIDRSQVGQQMSQASEQLAQLLHELRVEVGRVRLDLMTDQARSKALMQEQIDKSLKRNEQLAKSFVMTLTRVLGEGADAGSVHNDDRPPMQVPG